VNKLAKAKKIIYVCSIDCPNCKQNFNVLKEINVIAPAEKAVKEEKFYAEKGVPSTQTKLLEGAPVVTSA
jgi:hypothetical protein